MKLKSSRQLIPYLQLFALLSCAKSDSGIAEITPSVSISGSLSLSSGSAENYAVVVQDTATKELSIGTVSSDGSFSVSLSSSLSAAARFNKQARKFRTMAHPNHNTPNTTNSATVSIVDSNGTFIAPVTFGNASGSSVATAFKPEEGKNFGTIPLTVSSGSVTAPPKAAGITDSANIDSNYSADVNSSGVPNGTNSKGKIKSGSDQAIALASNSLVSNSDHRDRDKDGVPDLFDGDNENEAISDALKDSGNYSRVEQEGVPSSSGIDKINVWYQMKVGSWNTAKKFYDSNTTTTEEAIKSAATITYIVYSKCTNGNTPDKTISSITIKTNPGPAWLQTAKVANSPDLFSGKNYQFTEDTSRNACGQNAERWRLDLNPDQSIAKVGDTAFMDVSYTDGSSETVSASLSFRFDGIPELYFWNVGIAGWATEPSSAGFDANKKNWSSQVLTSTKEHGRNSGNIALCYASGTNKKDIEIAFKPPKDENGDWILPSKGLSLYALEFFYESNQTVSLSAVDGCTKDSSHNGADKFDCNNSGKTYSFTKNSSSTRMDITFSDSSLYYVGNNSANDPYLQVKIPREFFEHNNLEKIDIAPQKNGSNSAFMIYFKDETGCSGNVVGGGAA